MRKRRITAILVSIALLISSINVNVNTSFATNETVEEKYDYYGKVVNSEKTIENLNKQIVWADFSNATNMLEVDGKKVLQVGTKLVLNPIPDYEITLTVKELKPLMATNYFKQRIMKREGLTQADVDEWFNKVDDHGNNLIEKFLEARKFMIQWADKADPNNDKYWEGTNVWKKYIQEIPRGIQALAIIPKIDKNTAFKKDWRVSDFIKNADIAKKKEYNIYEEKYYVPTDEEAYITITEQNKKWSNLAVSGIEMTGKSVLQPLSREAGKKDVGVKFDISATYKGKSVEPTVMMADAEEIAFKGDDETATSYREWLGFHTNGTPWELLAQIGKDETRIPKIGGPDLIKQNYYKGKGTSNGAIDYSPIKSYPEYFYDNNDQTPALRKDKTISHGGLGTEFFSGYINNIDKFTTPLVVSNGCTELGVYISTYANQNVAFGFVVPDMGDAPKSYGKAEHLTLNTTGTDGNTVHHPFVGVNKADPDFYINPDDYNWENDALDEEDNIGGMPDDQKNDEGEHQLVGGDKWYGLHRVSEHQFELPILANKGEGNEKSYIKAWVDFDENGTFDENEGSEVIEVTEDGSVLKRFIFEKTFNDQNKLDQASLNKFGIRIRTALDKEQIVNPTGMAFTGEVEDIKAHLIYMPRGLTKKTKGVQGKAQTEDFNAENGFLALGNLARNYKVKNTMQIDGEHPVKIVKSDGTLVSEYTEDGEGTYTVAANGKVTFMPLKTFTGTAKGVVLRAVDFNNNDTGWKGTAEDRNDAPSHYSNNNKKNNGYLINGKETMDAVYIPTVTPVTPTAENKTSTGIQGMSQTETPTFTSGDENVMMEVSKTNPAYFVDADGNKIDGTTIDAVNEAGQKIGEYVLNTATGQITFNPNSDFVGTPKPAKIGAKDENGTQATASYTPTVIAVTPVGTPKETSGKQGKTQTGKVDFIAGDKKVPMNDAVPATFKDGTTKKVIKGEGTYTVSADGTVTFVPEKDFTGKGTGVTVVRQDINGTKAEAKYTPTVTAVTPTGDNETTRGPQGVAQSSKVDFVAGDKDVPMDDKVPAKLIDPKTKKEVDSVTIKGEGTYTVSADGTVTFTPEKSFGSKKETTGTKLTVVRVDINGTKAEGSYQATVTPVKPTAKDATSVNVQGQKQSGTPNFIGGDNNVPMDDKVAATFEDGTTKKVVKGEGTYTVAADGTVTFIPEKTFTGEAKGVVVVRQDTNGTTVKAKYTPTVTPVKPVGTPKETSGKQGEDQSGKVKFTAGDSKVPMDDKVAATFEDGTTKKVVKGEGTYTVSADGTVTFIPEKTFTGKAKGVVVIRKDINGTVAKAKYTPIVTPVTPVGVDELTSGKQGEKQSGKVEFTAGDKNVPMDDKIPATFEDGTTEKVVKGEGTYTVSADGTVTFVPEKTFTGKAKGVVVVRKDINGTVAKAKYTPIVTPVTPKGESEETVGKQGEKQSGKVEFTAGDKNVPMDDEIPATFEDGTTEKVVKGEGTYTVSADGTVTFIPEKTFTGKAKGVVVVRKDINGTIAKARYTPVVTPVTPKGESEETVGKQGQEQSAKVEFQGANKNVPMDDNVPATFEDGTTRKVVKGEGTYTVSPDGTVTFKPEPTFVGEAKGVVVVRKDINGTIAKAKYTPTVLAIELDKKITTNWVDNNGKTLKSAITSKDIQPKGKFKGYVYKGKRTDRHGNVTYIFIKETDGLPKTGTSNGNFVYPMLMILFGAYLFFERKIVNN